MQTQKLRRKFLGLLSASVSGAALVLVGRPVPVDAAADDSEKGKSFSGTSKSGKFNEALEAAIQAAVKSAPGADRQAKWTLNAVSGIKGGITGQNDITVTINAVVS